MRASHTFWSPRYCDSRLPNIRVSFLSGRSARSQRDERPQAILAEVEAEPDEDPEHDLAQERIPHPPPAADPPPDPSAQEARAQHPAAPNQADHHPPAPAAPKP